MPRPLDGPSAMGSVRSLTDVRFHESSFAGIEPYSVRRRRKNRRVARRVTIALILLMQGIAYLLWRFYH